MVSQGEQTVGHSLGSFSEFEESAIRESLHRILESPRFAASARSSQFLSYIVEETLAGRTDRIKAYSIGVDVFERDETFNAQDDPVVRVEAGRLRRKLEQYYQEEGRKDPTIIEIPKGGYVPKFSLNQGGRPAGSKIVSETGDAPTFNGRRFAESLRGWIAGAVVAALIGLAGIIFFGLPWSRTDVSALPEIGPRIIVLPFRDLGDGATSSLLSAALIDDIITNLGRYRELTVLGVQTSQSAGAEANPSVLRNELDVDYILEGSVRVAAQRFHVTVRLVDAGDGAVLWSRMYDQELTPDHMMEVQQATAEQVAIALAEPHGVVFESELEKVSDNPTGDMAAYLCTLQYYTYSAARDAGKHADVRNCLEKAVRDFPGYATAWALLAYLYIDEDRLGLNPGTETLSRSLNAAKKAVSLAPNDIRVLQSYMMALYFTNQNQEAIRIGEQAYDRGPGDPELLGQLGLVHAMAGSADRGRELLEAALERNPRNAGYYHGILAMGAYVNGEYDRALSEIEQVDKVKVPVYSHAVAAMIYAQTGSEDEARAELEVFQRLAPNFIDNLWYELDRRGFSKERQDRIVSGLRKAGATIPERPDPD